MTEALAPAGPAPLGPAPVGGAPEGLIALASLVGNAAFSKVATGGAAAPARLMRKPRGTMTPEETEADDRRKAEFAGKTFSKPVHEPPIGGRFGISYQPGAGVLTVTVRVLFDFQDFPEELAAKHEKKHCKWAADERAKWSGEFCARIADRWSGKHTIRCIKEGWEEFSVAPKVVVQPVSEAPAHYTVRVHKDLGGDRVRAGLDREKKEGDFSESNIEPEGKVDSTEAEAKRTQILEREKTRLGAALAALGGAGGNPIAFAPGDNNVPVAARAKLWDFGKALAASLPGAPRFPVQVLGECEPRESNRADLARSRADLVGTIVNGTSAGYPVRVSSRPDGEARRVTVSIGDPEEGWDNPYSVAEHEFGHMLGNPDEYDDPLHPHDEAKRKAWKAMVESAGVSVPMGGEEASTTSQMSKGTDVLPAHYATIWDALGELTAAYVTREEWTLKG